MPIELEEKIIEWAEDKLQSTASVLKEEHGDQSEVFKLSTPSGNHFLKTSQKDLEKECEKIKWLSGKLPVPDVLGYKKFDGRDALLLSSIDGENLAKLSKKWPAEKVVKKLSEAIKEFHSTKTEGFPFKEAQEGDVLLHGDACLPNFIFKEDNLSGYVDLGDLSVGNIEVDLSACIWSLQYNLGKGYGKMFLEEYGIKNPTEEIVENLRLKYENAQEEWGLR